MQSATPYLDPDTAAPTAIPRAIGTIRGSGWERAQDEYLTTTARVKGVAAAYDLAQCLTSPVQTMLAQQERLRATVMQSSGRSATMAGAADIYGTAGLVAKGGGVCGPFGFANSLYAYPGVASAVKDTLAEHRRMQDRMMKSLGPSATVAGTADIYATAGLVAKGSVVSEPFGFAKSVDAHRGAAYMSPAQNQVGEMLRTLDSLTASARAAVAHGTLGLVTGVSGYGPGFNDVGTIAGYGPGLNSVGTIAGLPSSLIDGSGLPRIPSAVTDMARALAGSAQLAATVRGVDSFTGLAVPKGIGEYLRTSAVAGEHAMPAAGAAEPTLIVPNAADSASLLDWLRDRAPTHGQAAYACHALAVLHALVMFAEYEASIDPSPTLARAELCSGAVFALLGLLLHWARPRD